jgi:hypothetical protein
MEHDTRGSRGESRQHPKSPRQVKEATTHEDEAESPGQSNDDGSNKMKYRCKLCGQLKQNHECPYRHSLHRSIGVMVYPAVNSFTAAEPGTVAPPLTHMNNFVSYDSHQSQSPVDSLTQANNLGSFTLSVQHDHYHPVTITPASIQTSGASLHSPQSSLSHDHSDEGLAHASPPPTKYMDRSKLRASDHEAGASSVRPSKAMPSRESGPEYYPGHSLLRQSVMNSTSQNQPLSIFVASVALRPEHYRAVTPLTPSSESTDTSGCGGDGGNYRYPIIPLTFTERKRLSDTLFHLSRELPTATADCAKLLREARQTGEWDLAVAELLTQVVVGLYCGEGDACLYGLQMYLLGLGIAC